MIALWLAFWALVAGATPCAVIGEPGDGPLDASQFMALAQGDDHSPALNALFDCVEANPLDSRVVVWDDRYTTRGTVHVRGDKTEQYPGTVVDLEGLPVVLQISAGQALFHNIVHVRGKGGTVYATRGTVEGVVLGYVLRTRFAGFDVRTVRRNCVSTAGFGGTPQNLIAADLGSVTGIDCGPSPGTSPGSVARLDLPFTLRVDNGQPQSSVNQLSTLSVDLSANPGDVKVGDLAFIAGRPYVLRGVVDEVAGTVQVFPYVEDLEQTAGTIEFASGAALYIIGGNTTGLRALTVSAQRAGVGIDHRGLYGGAFGNLTTEVTGVGLRWGSDIGGAHLGLYLAHAHIESTKAHLVQVQRSASGGQIGSFVVFSPEKMWGLTTRRSNRRWAMIEGITLRHEASYNADRVQLPENTEPGTPVFGNAPTMNEGTIVDANPTVQLVWSADANRLWAYDTFEALFMGEDGGDPGTVTFTLDPLDTSATINGATGTLVIDPTDAIRVYGTRLVNRQEWVIHHQHLD